MVAVTKDLVLSGHVQTCSGSIMWYCNSQALSRAIAVTPNSTAARATNSYGTDGEPNKGHDVS